MKLIKEIEIRYFRSVYNQSLSNLSDLNVFFGKNDSGKSNFLRALNLFFNEETNTNKPFDFITDFNHARLHQVNELEDARKFVSIKITFQPPKSWQTSLGKEFYVKKMWSITRQSEPIVEHTKLGPKKEQYVTRFLSAIKYHYIPAIKDRSIFESLLQSVYQAISKEAEFKKSLNTFAAELRKKTDVLSKGILDNLEISSQIAPPTDLSDLFKSLDFETSNTFGDNYSLTNQRGDGIQVRHIPAILAFLCDTGNSDLHIWGFEEPENSLELSLAIDEAMLFEEYSNQVNKQIFVTSHSPAFYSLKSEKTKRLFVRKEMVPDLKRETSHCHVLNGATESVSDLMGDTPHLGVISTYLEEFDKRLKEAERDQNSIMEEIQRMTKPILFVEGKSDELIIKKAWDLYSGTKMPFKIEECSGTSKMKSLACDGTALQRIAARKLFIFVDNDKECRELYVNGKLGKEGGKWATHNSNKSRWCRLPWHDEFSETMKTLKLQESNWPLSIENMFDYAVRKAALEEGAYKYSEKPHNELLSELGKISTIYRAADDCREYMYIMDIDFNYKISFAEWICKKATVENQFLLNFVGLVESLKEELNRKDS